MKSRLILLIWAVGFITGVAAQYIWERTTPEPDWLDCIELPECPVDLDVKAKVIRT